jgi:CheY-like chemotaxis protein
MKPLQGKRIFVVEDNVENRVVYQIFFTHECAVFEFERWGAQTIVQMKRFKPIDLIILDLMLPRGLTGYHLFDQIRAQPEFADVPVIAISAADPSIAIPKVREKGFAGFIAKPIDGTRFAEQLRRILAGESLWVES